MGRGSHAAAQLVDEQAHRGRIAREVVVQGLAAEIAGTTEADHTGADERGVIAGAVESILATLAEGGEGETVVLGSRAAEDDTGAIVEQQVGSIDGGNGALAGDVAIGGLQGDEGVGHVDVVPVTGYGLAARIGNELFQVGNTAHLAKHVDAATQQVVLGTRLKGLLEELHQPDGVDLRQKLLDEGQLIGPRYEAVAIVEVGVDFAHERGGSDVAIGNLILQATDDLFLGTRNL